MFRPAHPSQRNNTNSTVDSQLTMSKPSGSRKVRWPSWLRLRKRRREVTAEDMAFQAPGTSAATGEPDTKALRLSLLPHDKEAATTSRGAASREAVVTAVSTAARPASVVDVGAAAGDGPEMNLSVHGKMRSQKATCIQLSRRVHVRELDSESLGSEYSVELNDTSPTSGQDRYYLTGIRTRPDRTLRPLDGQQPAPDEQSSSPDQQLSWPNEEQLSADEELPMADQQLSRRRGTLSMLKAKFARLKQSLTKHRRSQPTLKGPNRTVPSTKRHRKGSEPETLTEAVLALSRYRLAKRKGGRSLPTPQERLLPTQQGQLLRKGPNSTVPSTKRHRKGSEPESLTEAVLALSRYRLAKRKGGRSLLTPQERLQPTQQVQWLGTQRNLLPMPDPSWLAQQRRTVSTVQEQPLRMRQGRSQPMPQRHSLPTQELSLSTQLRRSVPAVQGQPLLTLQERSRLTLQRRLLPPPGQLQSTLQERPVSPQRGRLLREQPCRQLPAPTERLLSTPLGPSEPTPVGQPLSALDQQLSKPKTTVPSTNRHRKGSEPDSVTQAVLALAESGRRLREKQKARNLQSTLQKQPQSTQQGRLLPEPPGRQLPAPTERLLSIPQGRSQPTTAGRPMSAPDQQLSKPNKTVPSAKRHRRGSEQESVTEAVLALARCRIVKRKGGRS